MTVFKGYILMVRKYAGNILMYVGIFSVLAVMISLSSGSSVEKGFTADKVNIMLVDEDDSQLSGIVADYLKKHHKVTEAEYDKNRLYEALYYQQANLVLRIPRGMGERAGEGENVIEMTQAPGSFDGVYVEQQISRLLAGILDYQNAGYTMEEGYQKIQDASEAKVSVMNLHGENSNYSNFFRCVPYMLIAGLGSGVASVVFAFRKKQVKNRMMASAIPLARQNAEGVLAIFLVGLIVLAATLAGAVACFGGGFLSDGLFPYYLLNLFIDMLLALAIAFLVGLLAKREMAVTMCITPLSLAFSFLGGVFMPVEYLSQGVRTLAKFIPVYWYEVVNGLLMRYSNISGTIKTQIWQAYGMQVLFVAAIFAVGLVIAKYQQQES